MILCQGQHTLSPLCVENFDTLLKVRKVELIKRLQGADADLAELRGLRDMEWVGLDSTRATPAALVGLEQTGLKTLSLGGVTMTDAHLAAVVRLRQLSGLFLSGSRVTSQQCRTIATMHWLGSLNLTVNPLIDDAGAEALGQLPQLRMLQLNGTKVSAAGIAALRRALPNCNISWDGAATAPPNTAPVSANSEVGSTCSTAKTSPVGRCWASKVGPLRTVSSSARPQRRLAMAG